MDARGSPDGADGVSAVLWSVCSELANLGHKVTLLVRTPLSEAGAARAHDAGFEVHECLHSRSRPSPVDFDRAWRRARPQVLHIHGAFYPHLAAAAMLATGRRVPYVYSPHGGLSPRVAHQRPRLRSAYRVGVERAVARHAYAAFGCVDEEVSDILALTGRPRQAVQTVAPPVPVVLDAGAPHWLGAARPGAPMTYLGRYEVFQKGLDRMVQLAHATPELPWALFGEAAERDRVRWESLLDGAPGNLVANAPVYGAAKWRALAAAGLYVQTSRFEGFPVSVAEALALGVPCAVSEEIGLATEIRDHDIGVMLPTGTAAAAATLRRVLADPDRLEAMSAKARAYALESFAPAAVARRYEAVYAGALGRP